MQRKCALNLCHPCCLPLLLSPLLQLLSLVVVVACCCVFSLFFFVAPGHTNKNKSADLTRARECAIFELKHKSQLMWPENFCVPIDRAQLTLLTVEWRWTEKDSARARERQRQPGSSLWSKCWPWPADAAGRNSHGKSYQWAALTVLIALNVCKFLMGNCCSMRLAKSSQSHARQTSRQTSRQTGRQRDRQTPWPELFLSLKKSCAMYFSNCYCKTFQIHAADKVTRGREESGSRGEGREVCGGLVETAALGCQINAKHSQCLASFNGYTKYANGLN